MKVICYSVLFGCFSTAISVGEVNAIALWLNKNSSAGETYTVPAGKVLIVESVRMSFSGGTTPSLTLNTTQNYQNDQNLTSLLQQFTIATDYTSGRLFEFDVPRRLNAGEVIRIPSTPSTVFAYYVFGLLIDEADLYAATIESEMEFGMVAGMRMDAEVKIESKRPSIVRVEKSEDLQNWTEVPQADIDITSDHAVAIVDTEREPGADREFLRAEVVARK